MDRLELVSAAMADEVAPASVEAMDRSELIALVRKLETQRSVWEARLRANEERETLYLTFLNDMGAYLAQTYQGLHDGVSAQARGAEKLIDAIRTTVARVQDV